MNTNFYWICSEPAPLYIDVADGTTIMIEYKVDRKDPRIHIGKRVGIGDGNVAFMWAQDPGRVLRICETRPEEFLVVDEYGTRFVGRSFLEILAKCEVAKRDLIGEESS